MKLTSLKNEQGVIGLYLAIVVLVLALGMVASVAFGILTQQQVIRNMVESSRAHYAAEAGAEDALLRLRNGMNWTSPYPVSLFGGSAATVSIFEDPVTGVRTVTVEGDSVNRIRNTEVVFEQTSTGVGFHYGAQVGDGGLQMDNNAIVNGNVFSNGNVTGGNGSRITGSLQVSGARPGKELDNVDIGVDAYVDECQDADVDGDLHTNDAGNCNVAGSTTNAGLPIAPIPLPIADSEIDDWKLDAAAGGTIANYTQANGTSGSLGPKKITGELIVDNNAILTVTGTLWVQGNVTIKNGAIVQLASGYGTASGVIISDDIILLDNGSISRGSGQAGSYVMYVSTSASTQAIESKNNAKADILYTNNGTIKVDNNAGLREVVGYRMHLLNNAVITYDVGLANAMFTSGPGGGWTVTSWKEIE